MEFYLACEAIYSSVISFPVLYYTKRIAGKRTECVLKAARQHRSPPLVSPPAFQPMSFLLCLYQIQIQLRSWWLRRRNLCVGTESIGGRGLCRLSGHERSGHGLSDHGLSDRAHRGSETSCCLFALLDVVRVEKLSKLSLSKLMREGLVG